MTSSVASSLKRVLPMFGKVSKAAIWIYTCHLLVFAGGVILGSVQTFGILCVIWGPCR